jgi:hypothetical protein
MALPTLPKLPGGRKVLVPVLVAVGAATLLGLWWGQVQQVKDLQRRLKISQEEAAKLETMTRDLTRAKQELENERTGLNDRLAQLRRELETANASLDRSRLGLEELQDRYETLEQTHDAMETELTRVTRDRDQAQQELASTRDEAAELQRSVVRLRERLALIERDFRAASAQVEELKLSPRPDVAIVSSTGPSGSSAVGSNPGIPAPTLMPGTVELPPIIVRKDQAGMTMAVRGRIVEVNDAYNFVVIDKGSSDGVRVGMTVDILRGNHTVGRATVVRVRPKLAACDLIRSQTPEPVQAGDVVIQRGL